MTALKLVMTLLVRDEEDIIESNIEYHLSQGVDFIIAKDNLSVDATPKILKSYERRGLLRYIYEDADDYSQYAWVTRMARMACIEHNADWVINCDADEFWWPMEAENLKAAVERVSGHCNVIVAERHNFICVRDRRSAFFFDDMIFRATCSITARGNRLPAKIAHVASGEVTVRQGNHLVDGLGTQHPCRDQVEILHFPVRTAAQFTNKILKGGAAYERNDTLHPGLGWTWRELYRDLKRNGDLEAYLSNHVYDGVRVRELLDEGVLAVDSRLKSYMAALKGSLESH